MPRRSVLVSGGVCLSTNVRGGGAPGVAGGLLAHTTVGCMGAGKALNLARLGMDVTLHTALGDDQPGRRVRDLLRRESIRLLAETDPEGTNTHINLMDAASVRTGIGIIAPSALPPVDLDRLEPVLGTADVVVLNPHGVCRPLLPRVAKLAAEVWCDLGDYRSDDDYFTGFADSADYVTMSGVHIDDRCRSSRR